MAAGYLFDKHGLAPVGQDTPAGLREVEARMQSQCEPHFRHYWTNSSLREQIVLAAIATLSFGSPSRPDMESLKRAYREADIAANTLVDRGLLIRYETGYGIFSELYKCWIVRELTSGAGGDYSFWLNQNSSSYSQVPSTLFSESHTIAAAINPKYWHLVTEWYSKAARGGWVQGLAEAREASPELGVWLQFSASQANRL
jgi:hypothetical protein